MFDSPFPDFISFYCSQNTPDQDFRILPEEHAAAESFGSQKRRDEFKLGRRCAHKALSRFGLESEPILRNFETREPCWPNSVWGSISHSAGFAAAAVGLKKEINGNDFQITYAKKGIFKEINKIPILVLYDGETIKSSSGNLTNFKFWDLI